MNPASLPVTSSDQLIQGLDQLCLGGHLHYRTGHTLAQVQDPYGAKDKKITSVPANKAD